MNSNARHHARMLAVQAIYSWQISKNHISEVEHYFLTEQTTKDTDLIYFHNLLVGVSTKTDYLDNRIRSYISRCIEKLGQVEKAILRIATYELSHLNSIPIPYRVVINEGIELAKMFGAEESHRFINGVLDKIASQTYSKHKTSYVYE
jgi:N utilization substance protein B